MAPLLPLNPLWPLLLLFPLGPLALLGLLLLGLLPPLCWSLFLFSFFSSTAPPRKFTISRFTPSVQSMIFSSMKSISSWMTISFSRTPLGERCLTRIFLKSLTMSYGSLLWTIPAMELKCRFFRMSWSVQSVTVASSLFLAWINHSLLAWSLPLHSAQPLTSVSLALSSSTGFPKWARRYLKIANSLPSLSTACLAGAWTATFSSLRASSTVKLTANL